MKAVLLCDLRPSNPALGRPPRERLPSREDILTAVRAAGPRMGFAHLDVHRCFDSCVLPPEARDLYVFEDSTGRLLGYDRLPFGATHAPFVVQRKISQIVRDALRANESLRGVTAFVYLDDIFIVAISVSQATDAASAIARGLEAAGFLISPKSTRTGSTTATALGCMWSATEPHCVPVIPPATFARLRAMARAANFSAGDLRRVAGACVWYAPEVLPFLQPLFASQVRGHSARHHRPHLIPYLMRALDFIQYASRCGRNASTLWSSVTAPRAVHMTDAVFVDAAATHARAGFVTHGSYSSLRIPAWIMATAESAERAQQLAELYALTKATTRAVRRGRDTLVVGDSASALLSALRMPAHVHAPARAVLLRRLAWHRVSASSSITFGYTPGAIIPADAPSRGIRPTASPHARIPVLPVPGLRPRSSLRKCGIVRTTLHQVSFA